MQYALVAGGSKGIGYAIAEALAKRNYNLVLIARHADALMAAKESFESLYHVQVQTITLDLCLSDAADTIAMWCLQKQLALKMLCNVAGLGGKHDYLTLPPAELRNMISVHVTSTMGLCLSLLPLLEKNAPSNILNVGSMAGLAPLPKKNLYSATKSAIIFFSYSLRYQLKKKNISVSCLCPGPVFTKQEIIEETAEQLGWFGKQMAVKPAIVGEVAVKNTLKGQMIIIPGMLSKIMAMILRLMPRRLITYIYFKMGEK